MGKLFLFPDQASTFAPEVDHLLYFLVAVTVFFSLLIFAAIFYFAVKYRRRSENELPHAEHTGYALEILWSVIPFGITMVMFAWGASVFFTASRPPADSIQIYAVGKQWMWKLEHLEGRREINELHIPVGRPVRLTMTSEDVIHSFFVPAFRTKQDVVPGKYSTVWFNATKPGKYHLFCAEYCGTKHSGMIGWVYVMKPEEYENWLSGGANEGTLAQQGEKLFTSLACNNCHKADNTGRGPNLANLFGSPVRLADGSVVKADEAYLRESILNPMSKLVGGYEPAMPTFQGLVNEHQVLQLIEYVRSIGPKPAGGSAPSSPASAEKQASPGAAPSKR